MDSLSLIVVMPVMILTAPFAGTARRFAAASRSGRGHAAGRLTPADALKRIGAAWRKARPPKPGAHDAAPVEHLYVPCARIRYHGNLAQPRRWVQVVPIVRKTAKWIYYASDSWDRREAVVSPGRISREEFETDTRCRGNWPAGTRGARCARHGQAREHCPPREGRCRHGYPVGVIPVPGDGRRPGPAGLLFFATREAAEDDLYRGGREQAGQAAPQAPPVAGQAPPQAPSVRELRRAMADAHPDRGGTAEQFIEARWRYQAAARAA